MQFHSGSSHSLHGIFDIACRTILMLKFFLPAQYHVLVSTLNTEVLISP